MPTVKQWEQEFLCWAGRWAFLRGRWNNIPACFDPPIHVISAGAGPIIRLCDTHFNEANAAGLVTEPFLDPDEFKHREPRWKG